MVNTVWRNADGLSVKFGVDEGKSGGGGEFHWAGEYAVLEYDIDWARLGAFTVVNVIDETTRFPNGCLLVSASLKTVVPFTSAGSPTMDIGFVDAINALTEYDYDGIDAAIAMTAIDAVGETVACDGALIGTILANDVPSLLIVRVNTANYTAGRAKLVIKWFFPTPAASPV